MAQLQGSHLVRHVNHSGGLQLLAHGQWQEVWATLDATELRLDGAVARGGMRIPVAALAAPPSQPPVDGPDRSSREHTFELQLSSEDIPVVRLAARTRSELHIWLLRLKRALDDLRPPPPPEPVVAEPSLPLDQIAWPHGTAGVPSLVSPSYPAWHEGPRPQPWRGHGQKPSFHWLHSSEELLRLTKALPAHMQALDALARQGAGGPRELHGRAALVGAPHDALNPWAAAGHVRGSERGRAVALLQEAAAAERRRAAAVERLVPRDRPTPVQLAAVPRVAAAASAQPAASALSPHSERRAANNATGTTDSARGTAGNAHAGARNPPQLRPAKCTREWVGGGLPSAGAQLSSAAALEAARQLRSAGATHRRAGHRHEWQA